MRIGNVILLVVLLLVICGHFFSATSVLAQSPPLPLPLDQVIEDLQLRNLPATRGECEVQTSCAFIGLGGAQKNIPAWTSEVVLTGAECPDGYECGGYRDYGKEKIGISATCDRWRAQFRADVFFVSERWTCHRYYGISNP